MTGTLLSSRYRLQRLLGQGGMGAVYEAIDETSGVRVAVKVVHAEVMRDASSRDDTTKLQRFTREAKAAAAIESEHVARVLDWGTDEGTGQPFMVMELLEGEDLQQVLKRVQLLPPDVALRIVAQACEGLEHAHAARVTHRDIKPANLFLERDAAGQVRVKLLDFGIAKIRPEGEEPGEVTNLTRTGSMLGSPRYMSPEQARGSRSLDHRSDLWSLGVVLYRAMTAHMPHEDAEAMGDFIVLLCSEPPRRVQKYAPWISPEVAAIVEGALQIDREKRFASASAMLAMIRARLPGGLALRMEDLAPMPEAARVPHVGAAGAPVAAPVAPSAAGGPAVGSITNEVTLALPHGRARGVATAPATSATPPGREDLGPPNTLANAPVEAVRRANRPVAPLVAGLGLLALGALAFGVLRGGDRSSEPSSGAGSAVGVTSSGAPVGGVRRANLVVFPEDAAVEIDGKPATAHDGVVELSGALGSVHRVRVRKDGQEKVVEVVLGEAGAEPPKVELSAPAPSTTASTAAAPAGGRPGPAPKKTAAPIAPGPPKNPLMPERFE